MANIITVMRKLYHVLLRSVPAVRHAVKIVQHVDGQIQASTATAEVKSASTNLREAAEAFYAILVAYKNTFATS